VSYCYLQILSNGKYRSVEHRAVVHPDKERISAAMFGSITVEPLPELVEKDSGGPRYKSVSYAEFMKRFFSAKLDGRKGHLDHFRIY
jgi:isopenicillin N synthase-like dioxygenase